MSKIIPFPSPDTAEIELMIQQTQAMRFRIIQALMGEQGRVPDDPTKILLLSKVLDAIDKTAAMEKRLHHEQESEQNQNQIAKALTAALKSIQTRATGQPEEGAVLAQYHPRPGEMDNGLSPLSWETLYPPSKEDEPDKAD